MTIVSRVRTYARFVKIEHTVFSLPLIFAGMLMHGTGWPAPGVFGLILLAAVAGRVVAMGLNRIIDARIDARNPRTRMRELPQGSLRLSEAWGVVIVAGLVYLGSAAWIAPICFKAAALPVALFVLYPYLKRFTALAHVGLGLAWSMAPLGGWLALAQDMALFGEIAALWCFSILWVTAFDVIYATLDEDFDRQAGLYSMPAVLGKVRALQVSAALHGLAFFILVHVWFWRFKTPLSLVCLLILGVLLFWQQRIAAHKPAFAFFQLNAVSGFVVLAFVWSGI